MKSLLMGNRIKGVFVTNRLGEQLGIIEDVMINMRDGAVEYAILQFDDAAAITKKYFAIPWSAFTINNNKEGFILDTLKVSLENAPGFDRNNLPNTAPDNYLEKNHQFYYG